jgi:Dimethlysulfonioproprionate lyase
VSLIAPTVVYPDNRHPPAEVYLVLSPGDWRRRDEDWFTPGIGGLLYNQPGILHGMRTAERPCSPFGVCGSA